jgi:hypothetical protein
VPSPWGYSLATATHALKLWHGDTLAGLAAKLEEAECVSDATAISVDDFAENFELMPEIEEEWAEDDEDSEDGPQATAPAILDRSRGLYQPLAPPTSRDR